MVKGLYTAYTGMINEQKRLDIISNNLANAATTGYKEDNVTNQSFNDVLAIKINDESEANNNRAIGSMRLGVKLGEVYTDYSQGSLRQTTNTYGMALDGKGFFTLSNTDKDGNVSTKYTRNGNFTTSNDGHVVDSEGNYLMGKAGEIVIPAGASKIVIDEQGAIYADGNYIDNVKITDFSDYKYLTKTNDTLYQTINGATEVGSTALVRQGYTEQSNVNVVSEMVNMIAVTRAYEANQKVIQSVDKTLDLSANSVGKI